MALDHIAGGSAQLWVKQLPDGPFSRLTFGEFAIRPSWTADGRYVVYVGADSARRRAVWKQRADGGAPPERLWELTNLPMLEGLLTPDGTTLVYTYGVGLGNSDIALVRLGVDTVGTPLLASAFDERGAALSPDGRWLAYVSNESGRDEVFVRPFPNVGEGRWQVSTEGGYAPRWAREGRELFFEPPDGGVMATPVAPAETFAPGAPRRVIPAGLSLVAASRVPYYEQLPGDGRFLMVRGTGTRERASDVQLVVVDNWTEELRARMGAK